MKIAKIGTDVIKVNEEDYNNVIRKISQSPRIHLIMLAFNDVSQEKIDWVIRTYPEVNRFIVEDNITEYNILLKYSNKKFYVINKIGYGLITFFKRNNKVLLDITRLSDKEQDFVLNYSFQDVLKNTEVILITDEMYKKHQLLLTKWTGNVILFDKTNIL